MPCSQMISMNCMPPRLIAIARLAMLPAANARILNSEMRDNGSGTFVPLQAKQIGPEAAEDRPTAPSHAGHPGHRQEGRAHGEDREAHVVHRDAAEHVAKPAERD